MLQRYLKLHAAPAEGAGSVPALRSVRLLHLKAVEPAVELSTTSSKLDELSHFSFFLPFFLFALPQL
jgi:hypothetical protein